MGDKRKLKRRELLCNYRVNNIETYETAGWLVDLTAQGMRLTGTTKFPIGRELVVSCDLPEEIFGRRNVRCKAKVCWVTPDVNTDLVATGLQFVEIPADDLELLVGFMARYALLS